MLLPSKWWTTSDSKTSLLVVIMLHDGPPKEQTATLADTRIDRWNIHRNQYAQKMAWFRDFKNSNYDQRPLSLALDRSIDLHKHNLTRPQQHHTTTTTTPPSFKPHYSTHPQLLHIHLLPSTNTTHSPSLIRHLNLPYSPPQHNSFATFTSVDTHLHILHTICRKWAPVLVTTIRKHKHKIVAMRHQCLRCQASAATSTQQIATLVAK